MMLNFNRQQKGFTLLEILIAMAIMALIGVSALSLLDTATTSSDYIEKSSKRLNKLQRTFLLISQDMQQLTSRSIRDEFGDQQPSMSIDLQASTPMIRLTRLGRRNPAQLPRSNLEHLIYSLEDKTFYRTSYTYADGMAAKQGLKRPLVEQVEDMKIAFYDGEEWHDTWPAQTTSFTTANSTNNASSGDLPVAVKFKLEFSDYGAIERLYTISDLANLNQINNQNSNFNNGNLNSQNFNNQNSNNSNSNNSNPNNPGNYNNGIDPADE